MRTIILGSSLAITVALLAGATPNLTPSALDCVYCAEESRCQSEFWHTTWYPARGGEDPDYSPPDHACQMGFCEDHGICGGGEEDADEVVLAAELEAIQNAILNEGPTGLRRVLDQASSRVTLNRTRMAVQVTGCSPGQIVAHFPLTEDQFELLPD